MAKSEKYSKCMKHIEMPTKTKVQKKKKNIARATKKKTQKRLGRHIFSEFVAMVSEAIIKERTFLLHL